MQNLEQVGAALPGVALRSRRRKQVSMLMPILVATILGVVGQLLLKYGMTQLGPLSLSVAQVPQIIWRVTTAPAVIGGLALYGVGTFFWLVALSRIELSVAYPFVSLNQILIFLAAWLLLNEQVNPMRAAGMLVICAGILLVARS